MAGSGLFAPPTEHWVPLSPRYLPLRRLSAALSWGLLAALFVTPVFLFVDRTTALVVAGGFLAVLGWRVIRQGALVRAWGYAERETDLYIKAGIFWRRLTVVPYGRMQAVEVTAGPLERAFNLATVRLVPVETSD